MQGSSVKFCAETLAPYPQQRRQPSPIEPQRKTNKCSAGFSAGLSCQDSAYIWGVNKEFANVNEAADWLLATLTAKSPSPHC